MFTSPEGWAGFSSLALKAGPNLHCRVFFFKVLRMQSRPSSLAGPSASNSDILDGTCNFYNLATASFLLIFSNLRLLAWRQLVSILYISFLLVQLFL